MGLGIKRIVMQNSWKILPQFDKQYLRNKAISLPINTAYPFEPEAKVIRKIKLKSQTIFDIGANTGFYSVVMEDLVGQENLYLFEPLPKLHKLLTNRFPEANTYNYAISSKKETQYIKVPIINGKLFETRATLEKELTQFGQTNCQKILVKKISLDEFIFDHKINSIGLLKIDVEGHELEVIKGATNSIQRFSPLLLIEIEQRHHKQPISKIFELLESLGFRGYFIDFMKFKLLPIEKFEVERYQNIKYLNSNARMKYINNFFFVDQLSESKFVVELNEIINQENKQIE